MDTRQREKNTTLLEWFDSILVALTITMLILTFVMRTVRVNGISMEPTLINGEQIIARSLLYEPAAGDIVIVDSGISYGEPLVKRVIGAGGDTININFETGEVFVNDKLIEEKYISAPTTRAFDVSFPLTVPNGKVFLMGDNRPLSKDSRSSEIGLIDKRDILGKVFLRLFPINRLGTVE
jgi:signal peptidase I